MGICLDKIKHFFSFKYATYYFKIGVFLLLSAPAISIIFFLPATFISLRERKESIFNEKSNICLIIASAFMVISCIQKSFPINFPYNSWSPSLSWYGLANWIPLFIFFLGFQSFVDSANARRQVSLLFVFGTMPLLFTGILQYFFKVYGPFQFLNGFIIWFSRSLDPDQGLTGVFNNPNYAGAWLSLVFPFSLALSLEKSRKITRTLSYIICFFIVFVSIFTFSRSNWLNIGLSSILILGKSSIYLLVPIFIILISLIIGCFYGFDVLSNNQFLGKIFIDTFCSKFKEIGFSNSHRLIIWNNAFDLIRNNWILGYGASSFSVLYFLRTARETTHSHNILFELAINYGLIASVLLAIFVSSLLLKSFKVIFFKKNLKKMYKNYDKAWWASIFVLTLSHLYDNQYYDFRISISSWILLAGLKTIINK